MDENKKILDIAIQHKRTIISSVTLASAVMIIVVWYSLNPISFRDIQESKIFALLGSLLVVILFLERALEVFVAICRNPKEIDLDDEIDFKKQEISELETSNSAEIQATKAELRELEKTRAKYKSETKKISLRIAFIIGIIISSTGIRTLGMLVIPDEFANLSAIQKSLFNLVDIFITAGLLAGGSDGIHKLANIYTNYMEAVANKVKTQSQ